MSAKRQVGLSKRDLEWAVAGAMRQLPHDPAELAKALTDLLVTLIDKNNQAIARALEREHDAEDEG